MESQKVTRLYSVDVFRIICAGVVFLFHSRIHIGVNYRVFNNFIGMGHIFMVAFFMLSGFSLFYVDNERGKFKESSFYPNVWGFIKRRLFNLYPGYIGLFVLHALTAILYYKNFNTKEFIIGLPMELGVFQSALVGSFGYLHNGGTWFVSCIFLCYLFYPYVAHLISKNSFKNNFALLVVLYCVSSYAFLPVYKLQFASIYANPLLRFTEFIIGVLVAKAFVDNKDANLAFINWLFVPLSYLILVLSITIGVRFLPNAVEMYNFVAIPCFACVLYFSARLETSHGFRCFRKAISILSENTYAFFLSQFFSWIPAQYLMANSSFFEQHASLKKLVISIIWTFFLTVFFHYGIEKPSKKILTRCYNRA